MTPAQTPAQTPAPTRTPVPPNEQMVAADGLRFRVLRWEPPRRRRTPLTIAIPGLGRTAEDFTALASVLRRDRIVYALDLPGFGGSERRGPYDPIAVGDRVGELALHLLEGFTGERRVDLVGHGMGGNVAIALAGARPDLVRRLVLINAPYRTRQRSVVRPLHHPTDVRRLLQPAADGHPAAAASAVAGWLRGHRGSRRQLPDVAVDKALLVWGTDLRRWAPPAAAVVLRDLARGTADSQQITVPGGGHRPHVTAADAVTPAIVQFLS